METISATENGQAYIGPKVAKIIYRLLIALGILVGLMALAIAFFIFIFDWNNLRDYAGGKASAAAGRDVAVGDIKIEWGWPVTRLHLRNLTIANIPESKDPQMVDLEGMDAAFNVRSLLIGKFTIPELILTKPKFVLEKNKDGDANWKLGTSPEGALATAPIPDERSEMPAIGRLVIDGGTIIYRDAATGSDLQLTANSVKGEAGKNENIHLNGTGTYQKQPFKIDLTGGSVLQLSETDDPFPIKLSLAVGKTAFTAEGTVQDPIQLAGLDLNLMIKGDNAADLFPLLGIALPQTPPYTLKGKLKLATSDGKPAEWQFNNFAGKLGSSDITGNLSYNVAGKRPLFKAAFVSSLLDFKDLGGLIGATPGNSAAATSEQKTETLEKHQESATLIPDAPLDISKLSAMDADVTFTGKRILQNNLPLDDFFMKITLDNSLLKVDPVRFGTAGGDIITYLTVNARQEPVKVDADFRFSKLELAKIFEGIADKLGQENVTKGIIGGVAKLTGTGKSLHEMLSHANGKIGIGMEGGQLSNLIVRLIGLNVAQALSLYIGGDIPTPVRCIVTDFDVKDGIGTIDAFVIDTKISNIAGAGTLNLKDEGLHIDLHPQSKDFSLVSLKSPIRIRGTMKNPDIGIDPTNVAARGGFATALAAVFPPAAVASFIDVGLGKDSDCAALLNEVKADTGQKGGKNLVPTNNEVAPPKN